ncbi:hypothetical protein Pmani_031870 [Petrolisthes manimaculis]|uniref:Uncharacterized protein n=1 Tax=Petrolisthes manimaculis TaxID=1843537 RepID=A0AAE1NSU4_9EUCA|nr:hypothetical protein Pmani_031870 [Petrolisthes manimaculis]
MICNHSIASPATSQLPLPIYNLTFHLTTSPSTSQPPLPPHTLLATSYSTLPHHNLPCHLTTSPATSQPPLPTHNLPCQLTISEPTLPLPPYHQEVTAGLRCDTRGGVGGSDCRGVRDRGGEGWEQGLGGAAYITRGEKWGRGEEGKGKG